MSGFTNWDFDLQIKSHLSESILTPLLVKYPTIAGPMTPLKLDIAFVIPNKVPAKEGLISTCVTLYPE